MLKLSVLYPELQQFVVNKCTKLDQFVLRNVNKKYFKMIEKINIDGKCDKFAEKGYLNLLKLARANNSPWDIYTCAHAAENGHLEVLKWLHENKCPWNEWTCVFAAEYKFLEILKWAYANGCECPQNIIDKYNLKI